MADWKKLPAEILNIIFLYLNTDEKPFAKKNLTQCALSCHDWKLAAQKVFFSEIILNNVRDIDEVCHLVLQNKELGTYVKTLCFTLKCDCSSVILTAMNTLFPNVKRLDFLQGRNLLYSSFCKVLTESEQFVNLEALPNPINQEQAELYMKCLDFSKNRITSIDLFDDSNNSGSLYQNLHDKLSEYPNLKNIVIHAPIYNMHLQNIPKYFKTTIIENNLISLQYLKIASTKDSSYAYLYTAENEALFSTNALKSLYITVQSECQMTPCEEFMLFMMHEFPKLNDFRFIENEKTSYYSSGTSVSLDATLYIFIKYLSEIPHCLFPNIVLRKDDSVPLVENFINVLDENSSRALQIIIVHLPYSTTDSMRTVVNLENIISKPHSIQLKIPSSKTLKESDLEQLQLIEHIGRFFDEIFLKVSLNKNIVSILNHITSHCTRLYRLTISGSGEKSEDPLFAYEEGAIKNSSLKTLVLTKCILSQEQLFYIITQLPCLENLVLKDCFMHKIALGQCFFPICLPTLLLDCMEIDMETDLDYTSAEIEGYFIKLLTDVDEKPRYCFLTVECNEKDNKKIAYNLVEDSTESTFHDSILNQKILTYFIYCKSVKKFTIKYIAAENGYHKKIDLLSGHSKCKITSS